LASCLSNLHYSYIVGRRTGNAEPVACALQFMCENEFYAGKQLSRVESDLDEYLKVMAACKQGPFYASSKLLREAVRNLKGVQENWFDDDTQHQLDSPMNAEGDNFATYKCEVSIHRLILAYFLGDYELAKECAKKSRVAEEVLKPCFSYCAQFFFDAMTSLALAPVSNKRKRIAHARKILKKLENLNTHCPDNVDHKVCLIKAELILLKGDPKKGIKKAMPLFEQACKSATNAGFLHIKALALERTSAALLRVGDEREANDFLKQAKEAYADWGAHAIVKSLDRRYSM